MDSLSNHDYPSDPAEHLWGPWMNRTGPPQPTQYRMCAHPACGGSETRETPKG